MPDHSKLRFDFLSLWDETEKIFHQNRHDPRLVLAAGHHSLTRQACIDLAGSGPSRYDGSTIWTRATTWKVPLIQVFALFPRPPLNLATEAFVMVHLLGDPIDTVQNLLLKISLCQKRVNKWKKGLENLGVPIVIRDESRMDDLAVTRAKQQIEEYRWKSLALVTDAYDEWGQAEEQVEVMQSLFDQAQDKQLVLDIGGRTSNALAADRATKYLPALVALTAFIGIIGVAMARTEAAIDSGTFNTSIFIGLEIHSIAYTSLYFWIIPTSLFGSFIGVSQTEVSIPCILERFHQDLQDHFSKTMLDDPRFSRIYTNINTLRSYVRDTDHRQFHGGIYSWHPSRWQSQTSRQPTTADRGQDSSGASLMSAPLLPPEGDGDFPEPQPTAFSRFTQWLSHLILPLLIVLIPTIGGSVASSLVPPTGWNCRVTGEVAIFLAWFASALANILINYIVPLRDDNRNKLFWATFGKDLLIAVGTIGCVIATIVGALNRCDCWIDQNGGLVLPQREDIDKTLRHWLAVDYPAWIFSSAAVELIIIPGWVLFRSGGALKVFVQRDDGKSNLEWFWDSWDWIQRSFRKRRRIHTFNMGDGNAS